MSYKLVAVDLDDSLLGNDHRISEANKKAIEGAANKGVIVTIATGRPLQSCLPYAKELELDVPFITYNGAMIIKGPAYEVIYHRIIDSQDAIEIIDHTEKFHPTYFVFQDNILYVNEFNERTERYSKMSTMKAHLKKDIRAIAQKDPTKVLLYHDPEDIRKIYHSIKDRFNGKLNYHISKPFFLEFVNKQASKGNALASLAIDYNIFPEEIIAIGDSFNDLSMIQYAGLGVAMANAHREVKEQADYITKTNVEHGVAEVLNRFIL